MNYLVRGARREDVNKLFDLAKQFTLLNLPANRSAINEKIEKSLASFNGDLDKEDAEYLFVVEELDSGYLCGSSQIIAKQGTSKVPAFSFKVAKKERFSQALGVGFIHQILRLNVTQDGPTEVGGLVVDRAYRRIPERLGKLISLSRFMYIGMNLDKFEDELHSEMAPPLTEEGRSEFWEALGRRFTGMPYAEADSLSQQNKEFIQTLFPEEDIYLCLLDAKARLVMGQVGEQTQAALSMLEKQGFKFKNEVDPFDGGPHLGVETKQLKLIKEMKFLKTSMSPRTVEPYLQPGLVGVQRDGEFLAGFTSYSIEKEGLCLPPSAIKVLNLEPGEEVGFVELES